ncbi:MAG: sigma-70 family RNA polymerase sigma factor [Ignavibacteria bacterium]|nr:sigma-70 family RNA polymerase sigma factor [Ignavibacteria bacterium]
MPESYSEIIQRLKSGDSSAFKIIADELKDKAFALTVKILKNKEEAEDSLQESFMKLYRAVIDNKFEERSKLSTYFYSIVYNTALDNYKKLKSKRFSIVSIDVDDSNFEEGDDLMKKYYETEIDKNIYEERHEMSTEKILKENEIENIIKNYIDNIPEQYSLILTMFYINDLSHEEITGILKLPIGTVKNRLFRAKAKLKEIILKKYSEEEILQYV